MTHLRIRTPEGVEFSLPLASPVARALALLVDSLIMWSLAVALFSVLGGLAVLAPDLANSLAILAMLVLPPAYAMILEWRNRGQTIGKRLFRLQVVDAEGLKLRPTQVVLRNLLRAVDFLPFFYLLGGATALLSPRSQRLGDLAAGTVVVRIPKPPRPDLDRIFGTRFNSLRAHPHLAARLRQRVPAAEAAIALQALVRREEIEPAPRLELFRALADHLRAQVEFPEEATDGLTDEQYVRAAVDLLYRPRLTVAMDAAAAAEPAARA